MENVKTIADLSSLLNGGFSAYCTFSTNSIYRSTSALLKPLFFLSSKNFFATVFVDPPLKFDAQTYFLIVVAFIQSIQGLPVLPSCSLAGYLELLWHGKCTYYHRTLPFEQLHRKQRAFDYHQKRIKSTCIGQEVVDKFWLVDYAY